MLRYIVYENDSRDLDRVGEGEAGKQTKMFILKRIRNH